MIENEDNLPADDPHDADRSRIAKVIARAGLASRRDAEAWIAEGRVALNGKKVESPAVNVGPRDKITVDGQPLPSRERTRLWLYHKPRGLVTTAKDPEGRPTVFDVLPEELPRVVSIGRLDINTEGLLLVTNDGGLARVLGHPSTGWLRRYRVRAYGDVDTEKLKALANGIEIDGFSYGPIEAELERQQGDNAWLMLGLREGKNREVRKVLEHLGLTVNRLIRVSFGPFQLGDLDEGAVEEIRTRYLREQLGGLAVEAECDFDAPIVDRSQPAPKRSVRGRSEEVPEGGRRSAGLTKDRHGRRVLVERIEKQPKPEPAARPSRTRHDRARDERPPRDDRRDPRGRDSRPPRRGEEAPRPFRAREDRPQEGRPRIDRPQGDRPLRDGRRGPPREGARPPRRDGDSPRPFRAREDRPQRDERERPARPAGDRPDGNRAHSFRARADRPQGDEHRGPPKDRDSRPARGENVRSRPAGARGPRPQGERPQGERPQAERFLGSRPARDNRRGPPRGDARAPQGERAGPRGFGGKPKPGGSRPAGSSHAGPPRGGRPFGKPGGGRPGGKPGGRPSGGKPPRSRG